MILFCLLHVRIKKRSALVRDLLNNNSLFVSQMYADKSLALLYCMLCWSKKGFQMASQSRIAVEAISNFATTVTVDWNVKARTNIQTNNLSPPQ